MNNQHTSAILPQDQQTFLKGDLIWAKVKGWPWWPGVIFGFEDDKIIISFLGEKTHTLLKKEKIKNWKDNFVQFNSAAKKNKKLGLSIDIAKKIMEGELDFQDHEKYLDEIKQKENRAENKEEITNYISKIEDLVADQVKNKVIDEQGEEEFGNSSEGKKDWDMLQRKRNRIEESNTRHEPEPQATTDTEMVGSIEHKDNDCEGGNQNQDNFELKKSENEKNLPNESCIDVKDNALVQSQLEMILISFKQSSQSLESVIKTLKFSNAPDSELLQTLISFYQKISNENSSMLHNFLVSLKNFSQFDGKLDQMIASGPFVIDQFVKNQKNEENPKLEKDTDQSDSQYKPFFELFSDICQENKIQTTAISNESNFYRKVIKGSFLRKYNSKARKEMQREKANRLRAKIEIENMLGCSVIIDNCDTYIYIYIDERVSISGDPKNGNVPGDHGVQERQFPRG